MTATIDLLSARSLTNAINKVMVPEPIVTKLVFGVPQPKASDKVDLEMVEPSGGLAQFAGTNGLAKPIRKHSRTIKTVTLPKTFEEYIFTAQELADYQALGQIYYASAQDRVNAMKEWIYTHVAELKNRILRRREMLACAAITTGLITIDQDDVNFEIDYGFTAGTHTVTLTGTDKWDNASSKPLKQFRAAKKNITKRSGYNVDYLFLGSDAASAFTSNSDIITALNAANNRIGAIDTNSQDNTIGGDYIGTINRVKIYEISQAYKNALGVETDMFGASLAVFVASKSPSFSLPVGPIFRVDSSGMPVVKSVEYLVESIVDKDGLSVEWKSEQKSLPVIGDPGALVAYTVV